MHKYVIACAIAKSWHWDFICSQFSVVLYLQDLWQQVLSLCSWVKWGCRYSFSFQAKCTWTSKMKTWKKKKGKKNVFDIFLKRKKKDNKSHLWKVFLFQRMRGFGATRIRRYEDSCLPSSIKTIKSCDWSPNTVARRERNRLDGPLLATTEDGMWVCVRKKWRWDRESTRGNETCLIGRAGRIAFSFFSAKREMTDGKRRLRRDEKKKWKNETKEADIKRKRGLDESKWEGSATETPLTWSQV